MSNYSDSLHTEFKKVAFSRLLHEFSHQVDCIAEQQSANQISRDDAIAQIGALIQSFRLDAKKLGVSQNYSFGIDSQSSFNKTLDDLAN